MGFADDTRVKLLLGGLLLSVFGLVGVVAFGLLSVASAVLAPPAGTPFLLALLEAVVPYLLAAAGLGILTAVLLVWLVVAAIRRASLPRDDRLASLARSVERYSEEARELDLADRFEPTTEDRVEQLKQAYVEGEITELEYERRLADLLDDRDAGDERFGRDRDRTRGRSDFDFER